MKPTAHGRWYSPDSTYTPLVEPDLAPTDTFSVSVTVLPALILVADSCGLICAAVRSE